MNVLRPTLTVTGALLVAALGVPAASAQSPGPVRVLLDLTPERIEAFRTAWREFSGLELDRIDASMEFESEFFATPELLEHPDLRSALPQSRDYAADEEFMIAGREDEYEDAARDWVERRLKGSATTERRRTPGTVRARLAWDHGPLVGAAKGPLGFQVGEDRWRLRLSKPIRMSSGQTWMLRGFLGEEHGEGWQCGITIGRNLLASRAR